MDGCRIVSDLMNDVFEGDQSCINARCRSFDRMPLTPLVRTHTPLIGAYVVLTGSGILVKELLLALDCIYTTTIIEDCLK